MAAVTAHKLSDTQGNNVALGREFDVISHVCEILRHLSKLNICRRRLACVVRWCSFFFVVKGPAADATNAPQPSGLLCNPVMKMINFFFVFPSNGAPVE